jgi:D-psicose/D-tagatose/L-ribulose 3-epimerase
MTTLGIHICSYLDHFSQDPTFAFPVLEKSGIQVVEVSILDDYSHDRARLIKNKAENHNLKLSCCTGLPTDSDLAEDSLLARANGIRYLKNCIDFCVSLGSNKLSGILYSPWGKIDRTRNKQDRWKTSVEPMREVCDYAASAGVTLCLESLNRFEGNFINTLSEGTEYLRMVNRANLKLLADTFHANIEEKDSLQAILSNIQNIGNIHITEANRDFPKQSNPFWEKLCSALKQSEYQDTLVYECSVKPFTEIGLAFNQWQDLLDGKSIFDEIDTSSRFISSLL